MLFNIGSITVDGVDFYYSYAGVYMNLCLNNLMENPFDDDDYHNSNRVLISCFLNQLVFRNTDKNEIFQAEYAGTCYYYRTDCIQITMNLRDYLRLVSKEFINVTPTMPLGLEMYTVDMLGAPFNHLWFNLRIEPDDPIEFDVILNLNSYVGITDIDYWTDEGILLIHFTTFIEVATVNASKLSLSAISRNNNQDANNTVNITSGEILNQSPSLARSVGIKLTVSDLALLASKGICNGGNIFQACYLDIKSGFAVAYFGFGVSPCTEQFSPLRDLTRGCSTGHQVNNFRRALTGELNVNHQGRIQQVAEGAQAPPWLGKIICLCLTQLAD